MVTTNSSGANGTPTTAADDDPNDIRNDPAAMGAFLADQDEGRIPLPDEGDAGPAAPPPDGPRRRRGRPRGVRDSQPRRRRTRAEISADRAQGAERAPAPAESTEPAEPAAPAAPRVAGPMPAIDDRYGWSSDAAEADIDLGPKSRWPRTWDDGRIREVDDLYALKFREDFYPRDGLIPRYIRWAGQATDISPAAHWAGIVAAVAAQLGRGQRLAQGNDGVVPSFFCLVLAESGGRKSYALRLLRSCLPDDTHDTSLPRSDTALLSILIDRPWRFWCLDEATSLFKLFGNEWSSSLAEFLCKIYDGDEVRTTTITRGELNTPPMHLSLLAMTTFATLLRGGIKSTAVEELIGGGLFGRFFVVPLHKPDTPRFEAGTPDETVRQFIKGYLTNLRRACPWDGTSRGERNWNTWDLTPEARLELMRWQKATGAGGMGDPPYDGIASMWTRLHVQVKRIALIYHLSRGKAQVGDPIGMESLLPALRLMHHYLLPSMLWFARKARYGELMVKVDRVRDELNAAKYGIKYSDICKVCGLSLKLRNEVLAILNNELAYERWLPRYNNRGGGAPHLVIIPRNKQRAELLRDDDVRPGERRTCQSAPPPPAVRNVVREMTDTEAELPVNIEKQLVTAVDPTSGDVMLVPEED